MWQSAQVRSSSGKERKPGKGGIILGAVAIMAACPIISSSRVGALVDLIQITLASLILLSAGNRTRAGQRRQGILIFLTISLSLGIFLGWAKLSPGSNQPPFKRTSWRETQCMAWLARWPAIIRFMEPDQAHLNPSFSSIASIRMSSGPHNCIMTGSKPESHLVGLGSD
jgi:hypothetical protein